VATNTESSSSSTNNDHDHGDATVCRPLCIELLNRKPSSGCSIINAEEVVREIVSKNFFGNAAAHTLLSSSLEPPVSLSHYERKDFQASAISYEKNNNQRFKPCKATSTPVQVAKHTSTRTHTLKNKIVYRTYHTRRSISLKKTRGPTIDGCQRETETSNRDIHAVSGRSIINADEIVQARR